MEIYSSAELLKARKRINERIKQLERRKKTSSVEYKQLMSQLNAAGFKLGFSNENKPGTDSFTKIAGGQKLTREQKAFLIKESESKRHTVGTVVKKEKRREKAAEKLLEKVDDKKMKKDTITALNEGLKASKSKYRFNSKGELVNSKGRVASEEVRKKYLKKSVSVIYKDLKDTIMKNREKLYAKESTNLAIKKREKLTMDEVIDIYETITHDLRDIEAEAKRVQQARTSALFRKG